MDVLKKGFTKNTFYSISGYGILVFTSVIYNAFLGRRLGAVDYGIFTAFFYLLIGFSQPINSLQLAVAKYAAGQNSDKQEIIQEITPTLLVFGFILFGIIMLISPLLIKFYHLRNIFQVLVGCGVIVIMFLLAGYRGVYQGKMDFLTYGANMGIEGMARLIFGVLFILLGYHIRGAIGASIASGFVGILVMIDGNPGLLISKFRLKLNKFVSLEFVKACTVLLPFGIINSLDLGMIQFLIGGKESGYISACGLFGKNLITLSLVFANVVFSYTLKNMGKTLWYGLGLSVLTFSVSGIVTKFAGKLIVLLVFGKEYSPVTDYLTLYVFASLPFGIMQNLVTFSIAKNINIIKVSIWFILAVLAVVYFFSIKLLSLTGFFYVMLGTGLIMDIVLLLFILKFIQKERLSY